MALPARGVTTFRGCQDHLQILLLYLAPARGATTFRGCQDHLQTLSAITYILEKIGGGVGSGSLSVPLRAACTSAQILSDLSGISMVLIPSGARASSTVLVSNCPSWL